MKAPTDRRALEQLWDLLETMSCEELERFCEGTMNAIIVAQQVFRDRFPEAWQRYNDKIEAGESDHAVKEFAKERQS